MKNYELEKFRKLNCCLCEQSFYTSKNYALMEIDKTETKDICDKCLKKYIKNKTNDTGCR